MMNLRSGAWWYAAAFGLVVVLGLGGTALAADPSGTWKWTVERGGNSFDQTLKLKQEGEKLTGTISGRQGSETAIEDGKVEGDSISFKVTREFNGNKFVMSYEGKVSDDAIKGQVKFSGRDGESRSRDWEAKRAD